MKISVVIPVRNGEAMLSQCLEHLRQGELLPAECIVVDDGSTDQSPAVAEKYGARLIRLPKSKGPAHARNIGVSFATSDIILFLDADVCVHRDTLTRIAESFANNPSLNAIIGAYDNSPSCPEVVSGYRNLLHHYVHTQSSRLASTFWTGCGAIRRDVFLACGGFNESYARPSIEDIELGVRLYEQGYHIELDPTIQVQHLKRWAFWDVVRTDILRRGMPWTELILRTGRMPVDLNLRIHDRLSVLAATLAIPVGIAAALSDGVNFLAPVLAAFFVLMMRLSVDEAIPGTRRATTFAMGGFFLLVIFLAAMQGSFLLPALLYGACLLVLAKNWLGRGNRKIGRIVGLIYGLYTAGFLFFCIQSLPGTPLVLAFSGLVLLVTILNLPFYLFLISQWGGLYCMAAVPLHFLFQLHCALGFILGAGRFVWDRIMRKQRPASNSISSESCSKKQTGQPLHN